jgi:hypothetical protein
MVGKEKAPGGPGAGWILVHLCYRNALVRPPDGLEGVISMMMQLGEQHVFHDGQNSITGYSGCQIIGWTNFIKKLILILKLTPSNCKH